MGLLGGIVSGILGGIGGALGASDSNKRVKKQMRMINQQKRENQDWYDRRYNEDATQRADAQAMLTRTAEAIKARNKAAAGTQAVMGGTEESVAATKAANAKALADATSAITVAGERRKDAIENSYLNRKDDLDEQLRGQASQKKSVANAAIGGAASGLGSIL